MSIVIKRLFFAMGLVCIPSLSAMDCSELSFWLQDPLSLTNEQVEAMRSGIGIERMRFMCPVNYQYWGFVGVLRVRGQGTEEIISAMPHGVRSDINVNKSKIERALQRLLSRTGMTVFDVIHAWACIALLQGQGDDAQTWVDSLRKRLPSARLPYWCASTIARAAHSLARVPVRGRRDLSSRLVRGSDGSSDDPAQATGTTSDEYTTEVCHQRRAAGREIGSSRDKSGEQSTVPVAFTEQGNSPEVNSDVAVLEESPTPVGGNDLPLPAEHGVERSSRQIDIAREDFDRLRGENDQLRDQVRVLQFELGVMEESRKFFMQTATQRAKEKADVEMDAYQQRVAMQGEITRLNARIAQLEREAEAVRRVSETGHAEATCEAGSSACVADLERQLRQMHDMVVLFGNVFDGLLRKGKITEGDIRDIFGILHADPGAGGSGMGVGHQPVGSNRGCDDPD
jgi:hypothetical protein